MKTKNAQSQVALLVVGPQSVIVLTDTSVLGPLRLLCCPTCWCWDLCAFVLFDTSAMRFVCLCVARHVGIEISTPSCHLTRRRWEPSFETSALGSLRLRVVRHVGVWIPMPSCRPTRWRCTS